MWVTLVFHVVVLAKRHEVNCIRMTFIYATPGYFQVHAILGHVGDTYLLCQRGIRKGARHLWYFEQDLSNLSFQPAVYMPWRTTHIAFSSTLEA